MELSAAVLAPEAREVGMLRALERAVVSGQPYVAIPLAHFQTLAEHIDQASDAEFDWCMAEDGKLHHDGRVAVICTRPKGEPHDCAAMHMTKRAKRAHHALHRSYLWWDAHVRSVLSP